MTLHELIDPAVCGRLCLTLLHSLWIAPLVALAAWATGRGSLNRSYATHTLALAVTLLALPTTYALVGTPASLLPQPGTEANTSPPPTSVQTHDAQPLTEWPAAAGSGFAEARQAPPAPASIDAVLLESPSVPAPADSPAAWVPWVPWATGLYLLGVLAMLLRLVAALWHASRLAQTGETLTDPAISNIATNLCHQWSMKVQPALRQVEHLVVPKVVGLVRPTILLPAAALTGLTASELEMILAHELAHVRRHDMWVNLVQRLAEAVLFFNPALWYLSRRISILREYCCDELACEAMSQSSSATRLRYAEALLHVVEISGNPEHRCGLAASAATGRSPSELRRRVARLFGEPVREPLRITRGGVVAVAIAALLLFAGPVVWTTRAADEPATEAETNVPNNAFDEAFEKAAKEKASGPATITGRIVLEDGSPATTKGWLYSDSTLETNSSTSSQSSTEGSYTDSFDIEVPAGTVWLTYFPDGYAPAWVGPLELQPGQHRDDITLTLKPGFSELVRVTNEQGEPVADATLHVHPEINGSADGPIRKHTTDEKGEFLLEHLADTRYSLNITAPGYEPLRTQPLRVEAGETLRPSLTRSQPGTGVVRFADGTPAPNTKIRAISEFCPQGPNQHFGNAGEGFWGSPWAETDSSGRFELDQLTTGSSYLFVVEAADSNRLIIRDLKAGQKNVQIVLPERRDLVVKIKGDLRQLKTGRDKPFVAVRQPVKVRISDHAHGSLIGADVTIEPIEGDPKRGGMAIFRGLGAEQDPDAGPQQVSVTLGYDHTTKHTIDLKPSGNVVEFDLGEAKPTFKSAEANSVQRDDGSALWFQSGEHVHFAVYYPGFFQRGLQYKQYFTLEHTTSLWRLNGSLNLREPGGEAFARQVPIDFDYRVPDLLLKIDGKAHDLAKGRVFVLDESGGVKQLPIEQVEPGAMNSKESLAVLREQIETHESKSTAAEAIPALQVVGNRFALCPVTTDLQRRLLDGVGGQADSASACLLVNAAAFETLAEIDGNAKGVAQLELFLSEYARRDGRELRIRTIDHGRGNVPFDRQERMKRLDSLLRKLGTDVGFASVAVTNTFGVSGGGNPFSWKQYIADSMDATKDRDPKQEEIVHLGSLSIMPVSTFLSHRLSNSDCIVDIVPIVRDVDGTRFVDDILPMVSRAMEVTPLAGGENLLIRIRYSETQRDAIETWINDIPGRKAYAKQFGFELCNVSMSQIAEQDELVEPDANRSPAPSLTVKLQDENGQPIAGAKVLVYDGNNFWAGQSVEFKQESASTNDSGVATFDQIASRIPQGKSCRVQVQSLDGAAWKPRHVTLGVHRGTRAGSDPLINLKTDDSNNRVVTFTLREHCPLDLEIVDATTGKPIHFAQLLFDDDRVEGWTLAALQDYAGDNDDPTRLGLDFSTTITPEMSGAKFMATCEGYYPHEFTLDEQLSPDKTVTKRIELRAAPTIAVTVTQPDGKLAVGAKFSYVGPKRRGSYSPIQATDAEGRTTIQFPELGELARWRVSHPTGETEVEARWYLRDHIEGESIEAKIRLADDTFSIHGKVTDPAGNPLADVRVRAATGIGTLLGGGRTTTDSDGRYKLRFGRGMMVMEDYAPLGVGVQAAQFYAEKPGWKLQVDEGHIFYLMTDQTPEQFAKLLADEDGKYWTKTSDDEVVYPHQPREVNFVLEREGG